MPITLYPHQETFVTEVNHSVAKHQKVIACAATGAGKTKMFIVITGRAISKGRTVLIITESRKIFSQIIAEQHGRLIAAGTNKLDLQPASVYIAMAQTLKRRAAMIQQFAALGKKLLVITDEAHIGTPSKILEQLPDAYHIGFTATPDSRAAPHIPILYNHVVIGPQPAMLVQAGYLSKYRHFNRKAADLSELKIEKGEYTEESQEAVFGSRFVFDGIIDDLNKILYHKAIVFCASIKDAEHTFDELTAAGFDCCCVHSKRPDYELLKFTDGPTRICVSVGMITKGFDYSDVDLVVIKRKTTSLPLFCQMCGRGSRISKVNEYFTILDYGMNWDYHGSWIMERDWVALAGPRKKKEKKGVPPIKLCPQCEAIIAVSARKCDFCGYEFPPPESEDPPESILVEVTSEYESIRGRQILSLSANELAIYARFLAKSKFAAAIARQQDIAAPGFLRSFGMAMGYKRGFEYAQKQLPAGHEIKDFVLR